MEQKYIESLPESSKGLLESDTQITQTTAYHSNTNEIPEDYDYVDDCDVDANGDVIDIDEIAVAAFEDLLRVCATSIFRFTNLVSMKRPKDRMDYIVKYSTTNSFCYLEQTDIFIDFAFEDCEPPDILITDTLARLIVKYGCPIGFSIGIERFVFYGNTSTYNKKTTD